MDFVEVTDGDPRLGAFYHGIYWSEFAAQHEPFESWRCALRGEQRYKMTLRLAVDGDTIAGGIAFERYPRSGCGLITYMVVAPSARRTGLGRRLQSGAVAELFHAGAPAVFGEVNDPRTTTLEPADQAWRRLERNQRWGARVLATRYIQPSLGPGLARDPGLLLIALSGDQPLPPDLPGPVVRSFVDELYDICEGGPPPAELAIPDRVPLIELHGDIGAGDP